MRKWLPIAVCAWLAVACRPSKAPDDVDFDYRERVIAADRSANLPLLVALHGLGDAPEQFLQVFDGLDVPVRVIAPKAPDPHDVGSSWFPIWDQLRAPGAIRTRAAQLARWIERIRATRPTRGRPLVTGFSQGGVLSFALAAYHPEQLAAAVPIAGFLPGDGPAPHKAPQSFRVIALHGTKDDRISYAGGVAAVERLRAAGTRASLITFPGVGHVISPAVAERYFAVLTEELARIH